MGRQSCRSGKAHQLFARCGVSDAGERRDFGPGGEPALFRSLQFELLHTVPHLPLSQAQFAGGPRLHPTVADEG